jgi:hypothetical protein
VNHQLVFVQDIVWLKILLVQIFFVTRCVFISLDDAVALEFVARLSVGETSTSTSLIFLT